MTPPPRGWGGVSTVRHPAPTPREETLAPASPARLAVAGVSDRRLRLSHGLEWAVEAGDIADGDDTASWLADVLAHGSGRNDAILLRHAHRAASDQQRA